jgi:tetratricopeptide (TPR) repeat protein
MMAACKVRDHSMATVFTRELGATPTGYIRDRRMETAARLLADTDLPIWKVGHLVFDRDLASFSAAFKRWAGCSPNAYRKAARKAATEADSVGHDLRKVAEALLSGGLAELTADQLDHLIHYLHAQREAAGPPAPPALAIDGSTVERGVALTMWERLRHLPPAEQKALVRQPYGLRSTTLFDVLREKSREEGRKDRQAGVRIAELAIASLDGVAAHLTSEELANKKAQGWAWLGNARGLALDYPAAEQGFTKARSMLPKEPWQEVLAETCELEADLFLFRSDFERALDLNDRAVELFRSVGKDDLLARSLVARASTIGRARGWQSSIPDLQEALECLDSTSQPHLLLAASQNLMSVYVLCGQHSKAIEMVPEVRILGKRVADPVALNQLLWTEALLKSSQDDYEAAERQALKARQGFASLGEFGYAAAVDLDLAEIALKVGQPANAVSYALRAMPILESLEIHRDAVKALTLLGTVAVDQEVRLETIREIQKCLTQLPPTALGLKA